MNAFPVKGEPATGSIIPYYDEKSLGRLIAARALGSGTLKLEANLVLRRAAPRPRRTAL